MKFFDKDKQIEIQGSKTFCSGSTHIDYPIITGPRNQKGWHMAVIDMKQSGLEADASFWDPLGVRGSVSHKIDFSSRLIPVTDMLGSQGDHYGQPGFGGGAIRFSAIQEGGERQSWMEPWTTSGVSVERTTSFKNNG